MLRNNKHTGIETSTTKRWFNSSLSKQLIHFLLNNGMISCSWLNVELLEIKEQGRMRPKLMMVTLNHIKHKPVGSNAPPLIQKWESILTCITEEKDDYDAVDCNRSGMLTPMAPLLPTVSRSGRDTTTSSISATLMSLSPTLEVRPLWQRGISRVWHSSHLHIEIQPSAGSGFATSHGKRLRHAHGILLLVLCQRPVYMTIRAGITRRSCVLETVRKYELWSPHFTTLPENRI